jgi:hypothetical protein
VGRAAIFCFGLGRIGEQRLYYEYEGEYKPLRFKMKEGEEKELERLSKSRMRKQGKQELSAVHIAYNRYEIVDN